MSKFFCLVFKKKKKKKKKKKIPSSHAICHICKSIIFFFFNVGMGILLYRFNVKLISDFIENKNKREKIIHVHASWKV